MACDYGVEAVAPRRRWQWPRDQTEQIETADGERLDRGMQSSRPVVGHERERRPRALAVGVEPGVWRDRDEAGKCRSVADVVGERHKPVPGRGFGAGNRSRTRIAALCCLARGVRGRRGRDDPSVREPVEEPATLVEGGRVRPDETDVGQREVSRSEERVGDREHGLGDD